MSGASIPYHLRPHKAVDRRLFVDLLSRCERWRPLTQAVYVSMGAYPLEDHKLIHRLLGIRKLLAFDYDAAIVKRQEFNRPINECRCVYAPSGDIAAQLGDILQKNEISDFTNLIVWLDYTAPSELGTQIREFQTLIGTFAEGDIARVTVNAEVETLGREKIKNQAPVRAEHLRAKRLEKLRTRIGEYLVSNARADDMTTDAYPVLLARAFGHAAFKAFPSGSKSFVPLSIVSYADGHRMLSMTGMVVSKSDEALIRAKLDLTSWKFSSADWSDVHFLAVPDLTLRERLYLERAVISSTADQIEKEMGFSFEAAPLSSRFIDSYQNYYRFYPSLLSAEL